VLSWGLMDLANFDLNQPATGHWFATPPPPGTDTFGGETRHFDSVTDAIRFVMEELTEAPHASAWITTGAGSLTLDEITILYSKLDRR
jgi:hypothetical protein